MQLRFMGAVDVARVSSVFKEALSSFMSRRKSTLTTQMFTDLFNRFPVSVAGRGGGKVAVETGSVLLTAFPLFFFSFFSNHFKVLCVSLLDAMVESITSGFRVHQQVENLVQLQY